MTKSTELIPHQTVSAIVENVDLALADVARAFELLQGAQDRLSQTLGSGSPYYNNRLWNDRISDYNLSDGAKHSREYITQNAWRYLFAVTALNSYMTPQRRNELEEQIKSNTLPPLTVENILGTMQGLAGRVNGLLEESIAQVFDWLRPRTEWGPGKLKTNSKFQVNRKVIVHATESNYSGGLRINYYRSKDVDQLGIVFRLLAGQGVERDSSLSRRYDAGQVDGIFEDEYFRMKGYKNGNIHIEFKRADLLKELNRLGGGGGIRKQPLGVEAA